MAGSINLSLSQQFDKLNGTLLSGGRVYFYAAGTDDPQDAFKDAGLTLVHQNPIILDSDGRVPQLYFADGAVHVRLTNSAGVVQFDEDSVLVVGASSGSGGGSSVDATAIYQTGDPLWVPVTGTRSGWVRLAGRTIGSATSGAAERASSDCQALFEFLWGNFGDSICAVSTGRGASALADWTANKTIGLLDMRNKTGFGLDDMGNSAASGFSGITFVRGNATTAAAILGAGTKAITQANLPNVNFTISGISLSDPGHAHSYTAPSANNQLYGVNSAGAPNSIFAQTSGTSTTGITIASQGSAASGGSDSVFDKMPPAMLGTWYQKL